MKRNYCCLKNNKSKMNIIKLIDCKSYLFLRKICKSWIRNCKKSVKWDKSDKLDTLEKLYKSAALCWLFAWISNRNLVNRFEVKIMTSGTVLRRYNASEVKLWKKNLRREVKRKRADNADGTLIDTYVNNLVASQ